MKAAEILDGFDEAAEQFTFPDLGHGYYHLIDARLHAYHENGLWALAVEVVGFNARSWDVIDVVHAFGNCLTSGRQGYENGDFHGRIANIAELVDHEASIPYLCRPGVPIVVQGNRVAVDVRPGAKLWDAFRLLVPTHRELLLGTEDEVRRRIPADLPRVLLLDEWNHPAAWPGPPSASETFQQLAEVLATGDASRYRPSRPPNTHWSNWPDSGSL